MSIKKHTALNLVGYVVPAAISLATVPLYLKYIEPARYGAWVMFWSFLTYFTVFQMGLPRAIANRVAQLGEASAVAQQEVFWTANWLSLGFTLLGGGLLYLSGHYTLGWAFPTDPALQAEVAEALPWLAAWIPTSAIGNLAVGVLEGRERFAIINLLQLLGFSAFQIIPLLAVLQWGPSLSVMMMAAVLVRTLWSGAQLLAALASLRIRSLCGYRGDEARQLLGYGAWSAATSLINPIMENVDRMLIGTFLGTKSVAFYSVPFGLTDKVRVVPDALQRSLFPRLSKQTQTADATAQAGHALRWLLAVMTLLLAPAMFALQPFLNFWVGKEFADQATPVGLIFLLGMWLSSPAYIGRVLLQARGRPDLVVKLQAIELLPYGVILWLCLVEWGLWGGAAAWAMRGAADTGLLLSRSGLLNQSVVPAVPCAVILGSAWYAAFTLSPSLGEAAIYAVAYGICGLLLTYLICPELLGSISRKHRPHPKKTVATKAAR